MGSPRRISFLISLFCFKIPEVLFAEIKRMNISSVPFKEVGVKVDIGGERLRFQETKAVEEKLQVKCSIKKGK